MTTALLGDRAAAEDVAAEAPARAYARWATVSGHAEPWVVTVATHSALDAGRRRVTATNRRLLLINAAAVDHVESRLDLRAVMVLKGWSATSAAAR